MSVATQLQSLQGKITLIRNQIDKMQLDDTFNTVGYQEYRRIRRELETELDRLYNRRNSLYPKFQKRDSRQ